MTALTTRDALVAELHRHKIARPAGEELTWCVCLAWSIDRGDLASDEWAHSEHVADALPVVDAATLADDDALVGHLENWVPLGFVPGKDPYSSITEAARAFLTALASALSERSPR